MYKYCVAQVDILGGVPHVSYRAHNDFFGGHLVSDIRHSEIVWSESAGEAKRRISNYNECVIPKYFEN